MQDVKVVRSKRRQILHNGLAGLSILTLILLLSQSWVSPSPPSFPTTYNGIPLTWEPDQEARRMVKFLKGKTILAVILQGGGESGIPQNRCVTKPENMARFIQGLRTAVRLKPTSGIPNRNQSPVEPYPGAESEVWDVFAVTYEKPYGKAGTVNLVFYADKYGYEKPGMARGTISPEFQEALRAVGIPSGGTGLPLS